MKQLIFFLIIMLLTFDGNCQQKDHHDLIERFVESVKNRDMSIQGLSDQGILCFSKASADSNNVSTNEYYQIVLESIREQLEICGRQNKNYEILTLEKALNKKHYNDNLEIPNKGNVYLIYCGESLITHVLVKNEKITSFSTINKGGRRIFSIL